VTGARDLRGSARKQNRRRLKPAVRQDAREAFSVNGDDCVLFQPFDPVLEFQLAPFQFGKLKIARSGTGEFFLKFALQSPVSCSSSARST
jgi:hypothetical protein